MPEDPVDFTQEMLLILTIYGSGASEPARANFDSVCILEDNIEVDYDLFCGGGYETVMVYGYSAVAIPRSDLPTSPPACGDNVWFIDPGLLPTPDGTPLFEPWHTPTPCPDLQPVAYFPITPMFEFNATQTSCENSLVGGPVPCPIQTLVRSQAEFDALFDGAPEYINRIQMDLGIELIDFDVYDLYIHVTPPSTAACSLQIDQITEECGNEVISWHRSTLCLQVIGMYSSVYVLVEKSTLPVVFQTTLAFMQ